MKKPTKIVIGIAATLLLVVGVKQGLKYYLQGPARPFNGLLISGNIENVNKAKEVYKEDTKESKEYKYKAVLNVEKMLDENGNIILEKPLDKNGKEIKDAEGIEQIKENRFLVITKSTAKEMLKDQVLRVKKDQEPTSGNIQTEILENIEDIDGNKNMFLGNKQRDKIMKINDTKITLKQGYETWIGYYPDEDGDVVIVDDNTYNSIKEDEKTIGLVKFKNKNKDLRSAEDKAEPIERLSNVENIQIDYVKVNR